MNNMTSSSPSILEKDLRRLEKKYQHKLRVNPDLTRALVSFQANKKEPGYRWYKFKEGYSSSLVKYYLDSLSIKNGYVHDPFAGSGTSLFASASRNLRTNGIELLPIGYEVMSVRKIISGNKKKKVIHALEKWLKEKPWKKEEGTVKLNYLNITKGAFPQKTEVAIGKYLHRLEKIKNPSIRRVLRFALLCIIEEVSYTRKDGQYLRWDHRSGRQQGSKPFDKGVIREFDQAITSKISEMIGDITGKDGSLFPQKSDIIDEKLIEIIQGSCFDELPKLNSGSFDLIITSPPYCNRYDYTRTYALELMLLGVDEKKIRELRQTMLSCTVENREKENLSERFSKTIFNKAGKSFDSQEYLQQVLGYLEDLKIKKELNNSGIVRMIKNYFYELCLLIFESARIMKKGGYFVMVNDNVRYAGVEIPADLILSDFATDAGLTVNEIQVLPRGKGNSSQQMGKHGRSEVRKCVYVWQKL
jgi:hypothetical protein